MIKLREKRSRDLIATGRLFQCLLALKANDEECKRADIIKAVMAAARAMGDTLSDEHMLIIKHFIESYHKLSPRKLERVKEETEMTTYFASTPTEFYINIGRSESVEKHRHEMEEKDKALKEKDQMLMDILMEQRKDLLDMLESQQISREAFVTRFEALEEKIKRFSK